MSAKGQNPETEVVSTQWSGEFAAPLLPEAEFGTRLSATRDISLAAEVADIGIDTVDPKYDARLKKSLFESGLYIDRGYHRVREVKNGYNYIVFPGEEWLQIALSPTQLSNRTYTRAQDADRKKPPAEKAASRADLREIAERSAGHMLEGQLKRLDALHTRVELEADLLRLLFREVDYGNLAHFSPAKMDALRILGHNSIHQAIEVSFINTKAGDATIDGVHRAAQHRLYGRELSPAARRTAWRGLVSMAGKYAEARRQEIITSMHKSEEALEVYGPALDRARAVGE